MSDCATYEYCPHWLMREPSSSMKNVSSCMLYTWVLCLFKVVYIIRWISFLMILWFQQGMVIENGWKCCAIAFFWPLLVPWNGWTYWCNCIFPNSSCSLEWMKMLVQLHFSKLLLLLGMDENDLVQLHFSKLLMLLKMDEYIGAITFFWTPLAPQMDGNIGAIAFF